MFDKGVVLKLSKSMLKFLFRVHDNGATPGDRFLQRLCCQKEESCAFGSGFCLLTVRVLPPRVVLVLADVAFVRASSFDAVGFAVFAGAEVAMMMSF